jgi:hypothetical protein
LNHRALGAEILLHFELTTANARSKKEFSLCIYSDVLGANNDKFNWFSNSMKSGLRKKPFYHAFGIEEHGICEGKKRHIKVLLAANKIKIERSKLFDSYFASSPIVAAMEESIVD